LFPRFKFGLNGVPIFFTISSFLISYLAILEINETGSFSKRDFFIRRALRIYPVYYLVLLLAFVALPPLSGFFHFPLSLPEEKWKFWFFLSNYDNSSYVFFLRLLWSVSIEEQFYIGFILLSFAFKRYPYWLCTFLALVYLVYFSIKPGPLVSNPYFNTLSHLPNFISGILIAKLYVARKEYLKHLLWVYASLFLVFCLYTYSTGQGIRYHLLTVAFGSSSLVICILLLQTSLATWTNKLYHWMEKAGNYTYGLYMYSGIAITVNIGFLDIKNSILAAFVVTIILIILAAISYRYMELPLLRLKSRFRRSE
jgi:peptidoglycan/LPS O-acetylase OafA/YrhL